MTARKKKEGIELVHLGGARVHLREASNLIEGLCYILPAVLKDHCELFINMWHAESAEV